VLSVNDAVGDESDAPLIPASLRASCTEAPASMYATARRARSRSSEFLGSLRGVSLAGVIGNPSLPPVVFSGSEVPTAAT
jgi:hypothetical protein